MTSNRITGGLIGVLLGVGLAAGQALALEADPERGQTAAGPCVACHQGNGSGMNVPGGESWPRLAGLAAEYIAKQLRDFKEGRRQNVTMTPFASMLNDQQIVDVAAYYSQLPVTEAQGGGDADQALLERGEQLALRGDWSEYIVSCKSCHGPRNEGASGTFPGIASQHAGYIETTGDVAQTLKEFGPTFHKHSSYGQVREVDGQVLGDHANWGEKGEKFQPWNVGQSRFEDLKEE